MFRTPNGSPRQCFIPPILEKYGNVSICPRDAEDYIESEIVVKLVDMSLMITEEKLKTSYFYNLHDVF